VRAGWLLALAFFALPAAAQPGAPPMSQLGEPSRDAPATTHTGPIEQPEGSGPVSVPAQGAATAPALIPMTDRGQVPAEAQEAWHARHGGRILGHVTIPDVKSGSLVQPEGRDWRGFHSVALPWAGAAVLLATLAALAVFYAWRGRVRVDAGLAGRTIPRFGVVERVNHWMVATSFITLALSGLNLTFGRWLFLPLLGPEAFTALSQLGKLAHNFLGFPFTLGILVMFALWVRGNLPSRLDITWIRQGGGMLGLGHPPAERFNAGQKAVFWMTVLGGGVVAASGYVLLFPFDFTDIRGQQWAQMAHAALAMLMMAGILGHIYIGTLGMEGASDAMVRGEVDANWAAQHHSLWARRIEECAESGSRLSAETAPPMMEKSSPAG